ncbi:MAG: serine/threonine-protein kinase [Akkermansia sp.]
MNEISESTLESNLLSALPEGTLLHEKYQIIKVIGFGGFGITYMAWDATISTHVVLKECLPEAYARRVEGAHEVQALSDETQGMFHGCVENTRQEAMTLSLFSHPGVVKVYDLFEENGTVYYVMELIHGKTLYDIMEELKAKGETLGAEQVEGLLWNLLDILEQLHEQKIFHCDIKPANIFIMPNGMPKLIDFGAVRSKELQHQGVVQITPGYTPPEFYPGRLRELGAWSDLYELGAVFYELLMGIVPISGDERFVCDRMIKVSTVAGLSDVYPMAILSSIDKALEPDYHNRYNSARLWMDYLDHYQTGRQIKMTGSVGAGKGAGLVLGQRGGISVGRGVISLRSSKKKSSCCVTFVIVLVILGVIVGYCNYTGAIRLDQWRQFDLKKMIPALQHEPKKPVVQKPVVRKVIVTTQRPAVREADRDRDRDRGSDSSSAFGSTVEQ